MRMRHPPVCFGCGGGVRRKEKNDTHTQTHRLPRAWEARESCSFLSRQNHHLPSQIIRFHTQCSLESHRCEASSSSCEKRLCLNPSSVKKEIKPWIIIIMHEWWTIFVVVIAVMIGSFVLVGLCCWAVRLITSEPISRTPSSIIYTKRKQPIDFRKKSSGSKNSTGRKELALDPDEEQEIVRELAHVWTRSSHIAVWSPFLPHACRWRPVSDVHPCTSKYNLE